MTGNSVGGFKEGKHGKWLQIPLSPCVRTPLCFSKMQLCQPPFTVDNTVSVDKYLLSHIKQSVHFFQIYLDTKKESQQ